MVTTLYHMKWNVHISAGSHHALSSIGIIIEPAMVWTFSAAAEYYPYTAISIKFLVPLVQRCLYTFSLIIIF